MSRPTDPRDEQFFVMLASCLSAARTAKLQTVLILQDGRELTDIPSGNLAALGRKDEVDDSTLSRQIVHAGQLVQTEAITEYRIRRPDRPR